MDIKLEYENLDELLVKLVKKHDNIYDKSNPNFKNKAIREQTWANICEFMKKPKDECHQRWNVLRTRYALEKRKYRSENKHPTWPLYESMIFLDKFMLPRKSYGNYRTVSTTSEFSPMCSIWDQKPVTITNNLDPSYISGADSLNDDDLDEKPNIHDMEMEDFSNSSQGGGTPITPKCFLGKPENEVTMPDVEGAFGRTIALMLKNIRGRKKRRKAQSEIMQLMCNYDTGSDTE